MKSFQETQRIFTSYIRAPGINPPPAVEIRRLQIYRDLVYNNIENFLANVFPVLRSIVKEGHWQELVNGFIGIHRCQTPYFLEMSQEFLQYLLQERGLQDGDPPYLLELAHYEWIELALDVSTAEIPAANVLPMDVLSARPRVSPVAVCLSYQYPVHKVSASHPDWQEESTYLLVYRNREDEVRFMEVNPLTARLLHLLQVDGDRYLCDQVKTIAGELGHSTSEPLKEQAKQLMGELYQLSVISHFD